MIQNVRGRVRRSPQTSPLYGQLKSGHSCTDPDVIVLPCLACFRQGVLVRVPDSHRFVIEGWAASVFWEHRILLSSTESPIAPQTSNSHPLVERHVICCTRFVPIFERWIHRPELAPRALVVAFTPPILHQSRMRRDAPTDLSRRRSEMSALIGSGICPGERMERLDHRFLIDRQRNGCRVRERARCRSNGYGRGDGCRRWWPRGSAAAAVEEAQTSRTQRQN